MQEMAQKFPVVAVTGPRQSGKTTLVKHLFKNYLYVNLEEIDKRQFASEDPRGFLNQYKGKLVIDEVQYAPELFSYIQAIADKKKQMGDFILTGSQSFLLIEKITQSLAGRVALFNLLPFSFEELKNTKHTFDNYSDFILKGFYPAVYDRNLAPGDWYPNYVNTYIERDVRQIMNVTNLLQFQQFMKLCAGSIGQVINFSGIGNSIGVSNNTIKHWLSVLETSFVTYRLLPFHKNFNKRIIKSPKLYFYDTGLACELLGIKTIDQFNSHYSRGSLFENLVITEILKNKLNSQKSFDLYFWRDSNHTEIDCLIEKVNSLLAIEIKSAQTVHKEFLKRLYNSASIFGNAKPILVYGGNENQIRSDVQVISWNSLSNLI